MTLASTGRRTALASEIPPVDRHIGVRVRELRKELRMSQTQLADSIGLTFQQVQKYERGFNRISASKLVEIARSLGVPVATLFDGLPDEAQGETGAQASPSAAVHAFLLSSDGLAVATCLPRLPQKLRRTIVTLIRRLAEDRHSDEDREVS